MKIESSYAVYFAECISVSKLRTGAHRFSEVMVNYRRCIWMAGDGDVE